MLLLPIGQEKLFFINEWFGGKTASNSSSYSILTLIPLTALIFIKNARA